MGLASRWCSWRRRPGTAGSLRSLALVGGWAGDVVLVLGAHRAVAGRPRLSREPALHLYQRRVPCSSSASCRSTGRAWADTAEAGALAVVAGGPAIAVVGNATSCGTGGSCAGGRRDRAGVGGARGRRRSTRAPPPARYAPQVAPADTGRHRDLGSPPWPVRPLRITRRRPPSTPAVGRRGIAEGPRRAVRGGRAPVEVLAIMGRARRAGVA